MLRNKLFAQPSVKETQISRQIANLATNEDYEPNKKLEKTLFLHYTHEKRLDSLKRDIHKIYSEVFQGSLASDMRLIIGHRNSRNTQLELIQKRPHSAFVKIPKVKRKLFLLHIKDTNCKNYMFIFRIIKPNVNN